MTPEEHFVHFAEFVKGVELAGGTTPHVAMTVQSMSRLDDPLEKLWFAGCYALTYNWPAAERLFLEVRPSEAPGILPWLEEHWDGLPLRKERKSVFRKTYFARSAAAYATFAWGMSGPAAWPETYTEAFDLFVRANYCMGRYIAIRWLEVMRRAFPDACAGWVMPSILSDGGQHSRKALALVYPGAAEALLGGNKPHELAASDHAAATLKLDLELTYGLKTNFYEMQSLLCEFKQSALGRKQYPGKSIDTEMDYMTKVLEHWGTYTTTTFWDVRRECFPEWTLGELNGWDGVRPELGRVLADFGYTWSDAIYDWGASKDDLSVPVKHDLWVARLL